MTRSKDIVANTALADAEPHYVAPHLIDTSGPSPRLAAGKCNACGSLNFPKAPVCAACLSEDIAAATLASTGTLYSFATVHQAPKNWVVPYHLGYVDLDDGIRVLAHIDGTPAIDGKVELAIGRVGTAGDGTPLSSYVFRPIMGGR